MYNLKDIKVGNKVVLCRKEWSKCIPVEKNIFTVVDIKGNTARCINCFNNVMVRNIDELVRVPYEGEVITVYKPSNVDEYPIWTGEMNKYDGKEVAVRECFVGGSEVPEFYSSDSDCFFSIWWLSPPEVLKESVQKKEDDLYCSCSNPNIKLVDYSIGGSKKEYEFCTCCKKEYLPF